MTLGLFDDLPAPLLRGPSVHAASERIATKNQAPRAGPTMASTLARLSLLRELKHPNGESSDKLGAPSVGTTKWPAYSAAILTLSSEVTSG